ncbi:O-Antigen ligase [Pirellulimonas nuda]|uniref:O-Antigen ligase n=1 Tax=Pirellulimonas nuda TaxID=2528009 RepID=A0A518DEU6_9BACT|nr:O-antigen ligase family protein [Pirellulimonas nuda]QDU90005.1 O-Antigen ligase [Pirellulimonas nuda]
MNAASTNPPLLTGWGLLAVLCIGSGFWFVDHSWDRAIRYAGVDELEYGTENDTADRLDDVNAESTLARVALAAVGGLLLLTQSGARLSLRDPLLVTLGLLGTFLVASYFWSENPGYTFFKLAVLAVFVLAAAGLSYRLPLGELATALVVVCLGYILLGVLVEVALGVFRPYGAYRFIGTSHPNTEAIFGGIVCLGAPVVASRSSNKPLVFWSLVAVGLACVWLTKSRTSLGALVLAFAAMQSLGLRRGSRMMVASILAFAVGFGCIAYSMLDSHSTERIETALAMGRTEELGSLTGRLPLWEELLDHVAKAPILGYGYLAFWDAERVEELSDLFSWEIPHGHNMYIDILLDGGTVGLALVVLLFAVGLVVTATRFLQTHDYASAFSFGVLLFCIANGFAESLFKLPGMGCFVVACLLLGHVWRREASEAPAAEPATRRPAYAGTTRRVMA